MAAVGVGLMSPEGAPLGALSVSLPTVRLSSARVRELAGALLRAKEALEAELAA